MIKPLIPLLIATMTLTACAGLRDSRVNPANWFGRSAPAAPAPENTNPLIPEQRLGLFRRARDAQPVDLSSPVTQVTELRAERVPGGVILRASGIDPVQGAYNVWMRAENPDLVPESGVLTFTLRRELPARPAPRGPDQSRTVTAAIRLTDQDIAGVRQLRVAGANNALTVRP